MSILKNLNNIFKTVLFLTIIVLIFMLSSCNKKEPMFDKNFVHSVYIWLNNPDNPDERKLFEESLNKFLSTSKYAKTNFIGAPAGTDREVVDNSYTYSIIVTFSSKEEQDLYQKEEAHLLFIKEASSLWNKVQIYDTVSIN
ncbi:Stress responsive A/B Barrel Domain [Aquimarina amphilecti]|uniref:Stress responsive A/B Barrel Domain n=1 Tax=Aquimarina amphilecti TaxID=1038014 RepID=A0A1H7HQK7_AQUAM|nr:Dabb family protein [Aquimarina amphilecti]SEK51782.1 Stress responsive A/B Barrel Domain [Aquimarina amphilecti]